MGFIICPQKHIIMSLKAIMAPEELIGVAL